MKLISINVGLPRMVDWKGQTVTTGIFKEAVPGPVMLRTLNLDGDRQADLTVHGGPEKAVYAYPQEHYAYWQAQLSEEELSWGAFGENFTVAGMAEESLNIGDRFRVGDAEVIITQPRFPCYKLGVKFGRADMVKLFMASRRTGFYFAVLKEGQVNTSDTFKLLSRDKNGVTVADITRLYAFDKTDVATTQRAVQVEALPASWVDYFRQRLEKL